MARLAAAVAVVGVEGEGHEAPLARFWAWMPAPCSFTPPYGEPTTSAGYSREAPKPLDR